MKILVVEDDKPTADFIVEGFEREGHTVDLAHDGLDGMMLACGGEYDVMVVDRMLPKLDGLNMVKTLRSQGNQTPVIFLSALGSLEDRVTGFEGGADDYLTKPFAFIELSARVNALARRGPGVPEATVLSARDLRLDRLKRIVTRSGEVVALQPTEFKLLEVLLERADQVVTKTMLLELVWDFHFDPKTSVVETHISRLRSKIDPPDEPGYIRTVRGAGYVVDTNL